MAWTSPRTWLNAPLASNTYDRFAKKRAKSTAPVTASVGRNRRAGSEFQRCVDVTIPPRIVAPPSQSFWSRPTRKFVVGCTAGCRSWPSNDTRACSAPVTLCRMPSERPFLVFPVILAALRIDVLSGKSANSPGSSGGWYAGGCPMRRE